MQIEVIESTQEDIDVFLGHNTQIMRAYYYAFINDQKESIKLGWDGIYMSLLAQIKRTCDWSIDATLTEAQRTEARRKAHLIIMDLCHVSNFFKNRISKEDLIEITRLIYSLRFQHPIGEAHVEADLIFKENVVRVIYTLNKHIRELQ